MLSIFYEKNNILFNSSFCSAIIKTFGKTNLEVNWVVKRIVLNLIWATINFVTFLVVYKLAVNTTYEYVFLALSALYCLVYWIVASTLFDKLIGNEMDYLKEQNLFKKG